MNDLLKNILAIWGAILSTCLALLQFFKHFKDKPKVKIEASFTNRPTDKDSEIKGTRMINKRHYYLEVLLSILIKNHGSRAIQISAIYLLLKGDKNTTEIRITPEGFPVVISPLCSVDANIQKEWIDGENVLRFGVVDGLGNHTDISDDNLKYILSTSNSMPSNKKKYVSKADPTEVVMAFQAKDKSITINKER